MKTALYARVSKGQDQNPENQVRALRQWAKDTGQDGVRLFVDELSSRDRRPQKEEVLRLARLGLVKTIAFVSLDRWGRSMEELVHEMGWMPDAGITLISLREGLKFDGAAGRLHAHILAAFAAFERDRIRERTIAGLERVRAQGKKRIGRHPKGCRCDLHRGPVRRGGVSRLPR